MVVTIQNHTIAAVTPIVATVKLTEVACFEIIQAQQDLRLLDYGSGTIQ
jgi:hypothetical protein